MAESSPIIYNKEITKVGIFCYEIIHFHQGIMNIAWLRKGRGYNILVQFAALRATEQPAR